MSESISGLEHETGRTGMRISVDRPAYSQVEFDAEYGRVKPVALTAKQSLTKFCRTRCNSCTPTNFLKGFLQFIPFIETLRTYRWKSDFLLDMLAGLSVGMVHIPQGMGFALLAAVAPVYGLYSSFWQVFLYMIFGSCRHLSIGTTAVISLIVGAVVEREVTVWKATHEEILANTSVISTTPFTYSAHSLHITINGSLGDPPGELGLTEEDKFRSSVASGMSLIAGLTMLCMGILQLGCLTTFMPTSFIGGFTTAAGFHIATTQLKFLLNVPVTRYGGVFNLPRSLIEVFKAVPLTSIPDLIVSIISFSFLVFIKEFINVKFKKKLKIPVPADMIVVIAATVISFAAKLHTRYGVKTVGHIPPGIPGPQIPNLERASSYFIDGMVAGVTSFAVSISMVDMLTKKHKYSYNPNRELVAYGITYGVTSFFHCFVGAGAPPRCFVMELAGGKTQLASAFSASLLLLVLLAIAPVFKFLPNAALACIIIVALFPLFKQFKILPRLWKLNKPDFLIWIVTFVVSIALDVSISLGVGITFAIIISAFPSLWAKGYSHSKMGHADLYAPSDHFENKSTDKNVLIFRFESNLYYLTVKKFVEELTNASSDMMDEPAVVDMTSESKDTIASALTENSPDHIKKTSTPLLEKTKNQIKTIVLDCSPMSYVDIMGLDTLRQIFNNYSDVGVNVVLANCNTIFVQKLKDAGLTHTGEHEGLVIYPTVQDAVALL